MEIKLQSTDHPFDGKLDEHRLADVLRAGGMLLCRSPLLADDWKRRLLEGTDADSPGAQPTPAVQTWRNWLHDCLPQEDDLPLPLTEAQEVFLWASAIEQDPTIDIDWRNARGLARHAASAYAILRDYRINPDLLRQGGNEESEALHRWLQAVKSRLEDEPGLKGRCLAADLPEAVMHVIPRLQAPSEILLDPSESLTPLQIELLEALRRHHCRIRWLQLERHPGKMTLTACADPAQEVICAAEEVARALQAEPEQRIGIVCDQREQAVALARELDKRLLTKNDAGRDIHAWPQRAVMTAGEPLSNAPMIHQLLHLLSLLGRVEISFADFSRLLFIPWLHGFAQERWQRAALDIALRRKNMHRLRLAGMAESGLTEGMPGLRRVLRDLMSWRLDARSATEWARDIQALLKAIGFLRADDADASEETPPRRDFEIRQVNALKEVLAEVVAFDALADRLSWERFFALLQDACARKLMQIPCRWPNVRILSLAQIQGLRFDTVIALGLDEEVLPAPPRPHPLIPVAVQKRHAVPGCDGERAYQEAVVLTKSMAHAAATVSLSFSRQKQTRETAASPLLIAMNGVQMREYQPPENNAFDPDRVMQQFDDAKAVPLVAETAVHGGTAVIKHQSACPFRAFATHRLHIEPLRETMPGIDPASKGSLLHQALEWLWRCLETRKRLEELDDAQRAQLIDEAIKHAWQRCRISVDAKTREYEKMRMRRILDAWLDIELQRPDFRVIEVEQRYELRLAEGSKRCFIVSIKVDRLDEDASGRRILIDYKTGAPQSPSQWLGERIREPQLPQYAIAAGIGERDAVSFARLRSGDMGFEGLAGEEVEIEGIKVCDGKRNAPDDWREVLSAWREAIHALAKEFAEGRCDVLPRDKSACRHCGLEAVCRIDEIGFAEEAESGEDR